MNDQHLDESRRIAHLISGFIRNDLTLEEREQLDEWIDANDENMQLFEKLTEENNIQSAMQWLDELEKKKKRPVVRSKVFSIQRVSVAAAIVIIVSSGWWIWKHNETPKTVTPALATTDTGIISPGTRKAILVTPGNTYDLTGTQTKTIEFDDSNRALERQDGLHYQAANETSIEHTLKTPAGGEYQVQLSDGTKAWLNASSTITYPTAFTGNDRHVSIEGEVYFEVAHNRSKPFTISFGDNNKVTVTGTRFNIRAYRSTAKVTLIEGSVLVKHNSQQVAMSPGQSSFVSENKLSIKEETETEHSIAWTKGEFDFQNASLEDIMEDVARWYNVTYQMEKPIHKIVTGRILRNSSLDEVLKMLTLSCGVHFSIVQREIVIRP